MGIRMPQNRYEKTPLAKPNENFAIMKKLLLLTSFLLGIGMMYGHKFAQNIDLPKYYSTYFGIERYTPKGFTLDSTACVVWQPFFQTNEYYGLQTQDAFKGMPIISEIYNSVDGQCVLLENFMQCDDTDSAFNVKLTKELRAMLHFDDAVPMVEVLKGVQSFYGKDARRLLNADTVYIANYKLDKPEIYNIESPNITGNFAYCTAIYAKRAGFAGHIGYLLMTEKGFADKDKYMNAHNTSVRYIDGWKSSDSIEANRDKVWWSFMIKESNKNPKPILK